jgi:hydrogenase nickel incorporation protein HypA/HybF
MHELSVVLEVINLVEKHARGNEAARVTRVSLGIGALSSVAPHYVKDLWRHAVKGTLLADAALVIDEIPASAHCRACGNTFATETPRKRCPACGSENVNITSGREFYIDEIEIEA